MVKHPGKRSIQAILTLAAYAQNHIFKKTHIHQRSFLDDSMATVMTIWANWKKDLEGQGLLLRSFLPLSEDFNFANSLTFCPILSDS